MLSATTASQRQSGRHAPRRTVLIALLSTLGVLLGAQATAAPVSDGPRYSHEITASGVVYSSPRGTFTVSGAIDVTHRWHGGGTGALGYPTGKRIGQGGSYAYQTFERGVVYTSPRGTHAVIGALDTTHRWHGGGTGALGYPTRHAVKQSGSYAYQTFERGVVYTSPHGTHAVVTGPIGNLHTSTGGGTGTLGYPTRHAGTTASGTVTQPFERGSVTQTGSTASVDGSGSSSSPAVYTLSQFMRAGVIHWSGYKFTYYSQSVLPGGGLSIPGRHVNAAGYVSDGDGYIVLANAAPIGTVIDTPFGYKGKVYDRGTHGSHYDVYIR